MLQRIELNRKIYQLIESIKLHIKLSMTLLILNIRRFIFKDWHMTHKTISMWVKVLFKVALYIPNPNKYTAFLRKGTSVPIHNTMELKQKYSTSILIENTPLDPSNQILAL